MNVLRARLRRDREKGQVTLFLVLVIPALLFLVALGVDGGGAVAAHTNAYNTAQAAARAGANHLSPSEAINTGAGHVGHTAPATAETYLATAGYGGSATRTDRTITVHAESWYETKLLSLIGISALPISATAAAELVSQ